MEILDSTNSGQSFLTDNLIAYIKETAKWAKFLAIVGFVLCGFMVILAFSVGAIFSNLPNSSYPVGMASGMITFIYSFCNPIFCSNIVFISVCYKYIESNSGF